MFDGDSEPHILHIKVRSEPDKRLILRGIDGAGLLPISCCYESRRVVRAVIDPQVVVRLTPL